MRLLFVKRRLAYPRSSGHDVHTWEMMRALAALGHSISFGSLGKIDDRSMVGLPVVAARDLLVQPSRGAAIPLTGLQERFRSYWGIEPEAVQEVGHFAEETNADAVILSGLELLPCLGGVRRGIRVWYAGDEWARHHLSLIQWRQPDSWHNLKPAVVKGLYEWTFAGSMDRVWVVSEDERRAVRRISRRPEVDVVANGVDTDHFAPTAISEMPRSACFWGRLDFEPNIDAVLWFCRNVWPLLRAVEPSAIFTVYGFQPSASVELVCRTTPGVRLAANLPDLRSEIQTHAIVVLPFVSGGGIKNKLLEAAALARPVVGSSKACEGLQEEAPIVRCNRPDQWVAEIRRLWHDDLRRSSLGSSARAWVMSAHSWSSAAHAAAIGLERSLESAAHIGR